MAQYAGQTSLVGEFLSEGEDAVTIHKVQATDNGLYTCFFSNRDFRGQASLVLQVTGVGSVPQVHITSRRRMGCMWCARPWASSQSPRCCGDTPGGSSSWSSPRSRPRTQRGCSAWRPLWRALLPPDLSLEAGFPGKPALAAAPAPAPGGCLLHPEGTFCTDAGAAAQSITCWVKEWNLQTKEEALKDTDWQKEQFRAWPATLDPGSCH
ncbi:uncharacterized protein LOC119252288 isoform X3 [Talpa occidentalis]|uniref:uncharacterized protein LOC119252288 isoform X3 n=1 Tax=Talpa occidentalis TaxID=50954 RepID=UPI00189053C1|nr:uncharacterized protein LOC119252288 isoform X3 [Talpa occidentalis]